MLEIWVQNISNCKTNDQNFLPEIHLMELIRRCDFPSNWASNYNRSGGNQISGNLFVFCVFMHSLSFVLQMSNSMKLKFPSSLFQSVQPDAASPMHVSTGFTFSYAKTCSKHRLKHFTERSQVDTVLALKNDISFDTTVKRKAHKIGPAAFFSHWMCNILL